MVYDAIIVGSGPVGSLLAHLFAQRNLRVLIVEKNSNKHVAREQKPDFIDSIDNWNYFPVESGCAGGNGWLWGGKCYLFDIPTLKSWGFCEQSIIDSERLLKQMLSVDFDSFSTYKPNEVAESFRLGNKNLFKYLNVDRNKRIDKIYEGFVTSIVRKESLLSVEVIAGKRREIFFSRKIIFCCGALGNAFNLLNLFHVGGLKFSDHPHFKLSRDIFKISDDRNIFGRYYITKSSNERALYMTNGNTKLCGQIDFRSGFSDIFKKIYLRTKFQIIRNFLLRLESFSRFFIFRMHTMNSNLFEWEFWSSQSAIESKNFIFLSKRKYKNKLQKISIKWSINFSKEIRSAFAAHGIDIPFGVVDDALKKARSGLHPSTHIPYVLGDGLSNMFELKSQDGVYFVSSGSFPDGHVFNPTWTILVLAHLWFGKVVS